MQPEIVFKLLGIVFLFYIIVFWAWRQFPIRYEHISTKTLTDIARRDLTVFGDYDAKFKQSLYTMFEHIFQKLYVARGYEFSTTAEKLHTWKLGNTYDPDLKIHCLIDEVCNDLEKRWYNYKQLRNNDTEPFNVNVKDLSLPGPSTVLRFNDHIDIASLYAFYNNEIEEMQCQEVGD